MRDTDDDGLALMLEKMRARIAHLEHTMTVIAGVVGLLIATAVYSLTEESAWRYVLMIGAVLFVAYLIRRGPK